MSRMDRNRNDFADPLANRVCLGHVIPLNRIGVTDDAFSNFSDHLNFAARAWQSRGRRRRSAERS